MGTRTSPSHLWFLFCFFAGFLSLSLLGSIYTTVFFILLMDILKDKAVIVWENLRESFCPGIVAVPGSLVEIEDYDSVVEEAAQMEMVSADEQSRGVQQNQSQPPSALEQAIIPITTRLLEVKEVQKLNRFIHPHPLTLKPSGAPYKCSGCLELGLGPSYRCETDNCNYILHEDCANVDANFLAFHRFFKGSNFMFSKEKPCGQRFCDACGNDVLGFFYHCDTTDKDLHPCCLKLKDSVSDEEGQVTLELRETVPKKCKKCEGRKLKNNIKGWSYVSRDEKYCFHVSCVKRSMLDKWKKGYFSELEMSLQTYDPTTRIPLTCKEMVKARRSSKGSVKIKVFTKIATVALELIVSVIFGNPAPLILTALGAISGVVRLNLLLNNFG